MVNNDHDSNNNNDGGKSPNILEIPHCDCFTGSKLLSFNTFLLKLLDFTHLCFQQLLHLTLLNKTCFQLILHYFFLHLTLLDYLTTWLLQSWVQQSLFETEPHSQPEANKWIRIFSFLSRSNLTDSVVTDNTSLQRSARYREVSGWQSGIYAWFELL